MPNTPQTEAAMSDELDNLLLNARTDEYGDSGNYNETKLKQLINTHTQAAIAAREVDIRLDELNNLPDCNIESKYHGSTGVILVKDVIKRITELKKAKGE